MNHLEAGSGSPRSVPEIVRESLEDMGAREARGPAQAEAVCVCVYTCICMCICLHVCTYVYMSLYIYMCVYVCTCMYMCMSICEYVCIGMCVCVYMYVRVCVGGTWGRTQMCHRSCVLGGCRGPCESERADWAPASRPWAGRVAACVERPRRSSQHWGRSGGDRFCFFLQRNSQGARSFPSPGGV